MARFALQQAFPSTWIDEVVEAHRKRRLPILSAPINWEEIEQRCDEMVKYAAATTHTCTADPEAILRRFTRAEVMHPTYKGALAGGGEILC